MHSQADLNEQLAQIYSRVSLECKSYLENDPLITRQDTCKGLLALLEQLKNVLVTINSKKVEERARHYYVAYNAINYIIDISEHLRKTNFSFEIISILAEGIKTMEENLILNDVKYLDKRTQLYLKMAKIYQSWENYPEAATLLDAAIKAYKNIKSIHEQDPPVPPYIITILNNNIKIIKIYHIKYCIQAGLLTPADWKKKAEEEFGDDNEIKLMSLIESLKTETKKHSNIFTKNFKNYKETLLQGGYQMVRPHLQTLSKGLTQQKERIERQVNFKSMSNTTQQEINQQIKKKRDAEDKYVRQSQIRKASEAFPLQYHAELIHYALQTKSSKILNELIEHAKIRTECRRIEVPYVNDVMITVSNSPYPNVPNGYTKIPVDLNQANMIKQLTKLRKSGKKAPQEEQPKQVVQPAKEEKKDSKKPGKQPPPQQPVSKQKEISNQPSEWELKEIQHKYVFMMVKKSMSPEGALYDLGVVMGNQENGPVGFTDNRKIIVPYIQQNMRIVESQVKQYTGVRQTTGLVPYLILYHSRDELRNEEQRKTLVTDVAPLIGKNPMVPAKWGYKKIDVDLRQVPIQFIKAPNHDYVYLTYKTDELFHINERHIQIISSFVELENSYNQKKGGNNQDEKWIQLQINYDIEKLSLFFQTVQQALRGQLGQQYYRQRCDFLTSLTFEIWTKYLKNALLQLDYMKQQRLNGQIIDYDYEIYKSIIDKCSPVFLRGMKILNIIMVNNPKGDILLESKINLELSKLLEESKLYKMATENVKLCLGKLRKYRDEYLAKGVDGSSDKLLPFCVTNSSAQIKRVINEMKKKYSKQRLQIEKQLRIQGRRDKGEKQLSPEQLEEQEKQFIKYRKADSFDETVDKVSTSHSQVYSIVSSIELDMLNLYFRISLKRSEQLTIMEQSKNDMTNGIKNTELEGLSNTMKKKLALNEGMTQTKNMKNLSELQNTLVKANQLPTPKPKLQKMQAKLISENKKNPYNMALLMVNLAAQNSDSKDKRYYLEQGLRYLAQCRNLQQSMMNKAIENAIFIFSGLWDNKIVEDQSSQKIAPFNNLYTRIWQEPTEVPEQPILVSKNSSAIQLKLPPFIPHKRSQKDEQRQVKFMSIYGKPSANGVDVSLNCVELEGTGIRKQIGKTVKVSSLAPNTLYCFAAAGIDNNEDNMGIGKTGEDIGTFNPFSIPMLASYLAKISYQINEYDVAEKAADIVLKQFCIETSYLTGDERINNLSHYSINEERIRGTSLIQIKAISESFYVAALCQRRKLNQLKETQGQIKPKVIFQEKEKLITNLLMLSSCLAPCLHSPNMSIPFLIPEKEVLQRALVINMIPDKWMNPKMRKLGVNVMTKLLRWGLQNNQINLARKLVYKWNERKYILMGKMIQVEEKKEVKKGVKEPKDQQVKMVDKYCRFMVQKSPQLMDVFEDSIATISEEYYDYVSLFVQKAKDQVSNLSQYVDNPSEQIEQMSNNLNAKLQLVEYMKEPIQSIKKFTSASPFYLEYNSKILKKSLEVAAESQYKTLNQKAQELEIPELSEQCKLARQIYDLVFQAIRADIEWAPSSKEELAQFQKHTGKDLSKAIDIFTNWEQKKIQLTKNLSRCISLKNKFKDFDYLNIWSGELYHLKAQCNIITSCNDFEVRRKIKVRYDRIKAMNLDDLIKKQKEVSILQDKPYRYSQDQLKKITQILAYLSQSIYSSLLIQGWLKMQSTIKFLCNFLAYIEVTPFYHQNSDVYSYFTFISLCIIEMLSSIKKNGFWQFKERYNRKLINTEIANIYDKLQLEQFSPDPLIEQYVVEYYQPNLDSSTTKTFWFTQEQYIDIEPLSSIISYTINTLRLENKHNLVINIVRDFSNVIQHYYSLLLLPFMTNSQSKLLQDVEKMIQKENEDLFAVQQKFNAEKEKVGKKRAYQMSGQKMEFEKEYEEKSNKIKTSLQFLNNQKEFIENQMYKSNRIKDEITRDTSKQVLAQEEQKKYTYEFGQHYEQMCKEFGEQAKHVMKSKTFIKDIINKYDSIYEQLKNSKTSKDTLAQIQNRNEVGNLWFASGNLEKAFQFWNDSLATIFKKVKPIENYHDILSQNKDFLVKSVGQKQVLISICLLFKIAKFTCGHRIQMQKAAVHFACILTYSLFQTNLDYPQSYLMYKDFRIKSFPSSSILYDESSIKLTQLLSALQYFVTKNIYDENALSALPIVAFYQHIGTDVVKNAQISIKAKIYRSILLAESGLIAEAMTFLIKVANQKDLPVLWLDSSDFLKKQKGMNWVSETATYNNSELWTNSQNKAIIEEFKKLVMKPQTSQQNGIINPILFNYSKALTLFKIYEVQLSKDEVLNEQRLQALNEVEVIMRESLKKTAVIQQFYSLLEQYDALSKAYKKEVDDEIKKNMDSAKSKMIQFLKKNGIEDSNIKYYENEQSSALKRSYRLEFMCRIRFSLHKIYQARNVLVNSYFVLKNGLSNIHRYAFGARLCETGSDPEIKTIAIAPAPTDKKADKKGGKKEQEVSQGIVAPPVDVERQKQLREKAQAKAHRTSLNSFWHLKILFEIGKLLYKQNNFKEAIKILQITIQNCKKNEEQYFLLHSCAFLLRANLRLGSFRPDQFKRVIQQLENMHFLDENYMNLVVDFGQLLAGQPQSLEYLNKGKQVASKLWKQFGMKSVMTGIGLKVAPRKYYIKEEMSADQEQAIKRKKKAEKKGGKDDKKAAKKEDPKKKKEDSKLEYKVTPLSKLNEVSLLEEEKYLFGEYSIEPHPNYHKNNIYQPYSRYYIKAYLRVLTEQINTNNKQSYLEQVDFILKILTVLESYPYPTDHTKMVLYACLGKIHKNAFLLELNKTLKQSRDIYLNSVKTPFEDLPLNNTLIQLPAYSDFLTENKQLLEKAKQYFKKSLLLIQNSILFLERGFPMEDIAWEYADNQCLLAEYVGRDRPKFVPEDQVCLNPDEIKLQSLNAIVEAVGFLNFGIKIKSIKFQLERNYMEIGGKGFDANAKIDEDINSQIMQIDKQCKKGYPQFLLDSLKNKGTINGADLITYMLKACREAEFMTFTNPSYQRTIYKCNRLLSKYLPGYKQKCQLTSLEVPLKKTLKDKFIEEDTLVIKSIRSGKHETFLYIVAPLNQNDSIRFGRVVIELSTLSKITEDLLSLTTRTAISDKKSEAVKNRDYILHRKQFKRILLDLSVRFGNPKTDGQIKLIEDEYLVELNGENLKTMNKLLDTNGFNGKNAQVCNYWRKLHELKYGC